MLGALRLVPQCLLQRLSNSNIDGRILAKVGPGLVKYAVEPFLLTPAGAPGGQPFGAVFQSSLNGLACGFAQYKGANC